MRRKGKRVRKWENARANLKPKFEAAGITSCELRFDGCWRDNALGFAHAKKRRKLTEEELEVVILVCNSCHDKIEYLPAEEMEKIVMDTIANREVDLFLKKLEVPNFSEE